MRKNVFLISSLVSSMLLLSACGGSSDSDDESYADAYLQFYNGSPNSPTTQMLADDELQGSSSYGDVTSLFTFSSGDVDLELQWEDSDGQDVSVETLTTNMRDGYKNLIVMAGDFEAPDVVEFQFERSNNDGYFYLYGTSLTGSGDSYDLYMAEHGTPFSSANFITTLSYTSFSDTDYWDPEDDDTKAWPEGEYVIYLTAPGEQEVLFESQEIDFNFTSDYVMMVRNTTGANDNNLVIDFVLNSTSIEANQNVTATSQFRVYSALANDDELTITLDSTVDEPVTQTLTVGELSAFTSVDYGDYQVTATATTMSNYGFDNRLLTLNQGVSKTLLVFENDAQELTSIEVEDSALPQSFEHEVNVANILAEYNDVDVYFVRQDETVESAEYKLTNVSYGDVRTITLPNAFYSIVAVYEDALGVSSLLYRSELEDFTDDDVVVVAIEAEAESTSGTGYRASILRH